MLEIMPRITVRSQTHGDTVHYFSEVYRLLLIDCDLVCVSDPLKRQSTRETMQRILTLAHRVPLSTAARLQQAQFSVAARETWGVFPREREGNSYAVNWSLTEHGVVSVGDSFRNARNSLLEQRSGGKVDGGKISVSKPTYMGNYKVEEAGDEITHQKFSELLSNQQEYLSSGVDLFVEDASVGSSTRGRLGVRVVSDSSAVAMVARNLLITSPAYKLDHRARFNGWNKDPRWIGVPEGHFDEVRIQ